MSGVGTLRLAPILVNWFLLEHTCGCVLQWQIGTVVIVCLSEKPKRFSIGPLPKKLSGPCSMLVIKIFKVGVNHIRAHWENLRKTHLNWLFIYLLTDFSFSEGQAIWLCMLGFNLYMNQILNFNINYCSISYFGYVWNYF